MNTKNLNLPSFFSLIISASIFIIGDCQDISLYPCVTKLIPCQPLLVDPSEPPTESCCQPLNQLLASPNDTMCLCNILDNPIIMKSFNVTKEDAFKLARACGAKSDHSLCQTAPSPGLVPSPRTNDTSPNGTAAPPSSKKSAAANVLSSFRCFPFIVLIFAFFL